MRWGDVDRDDYSYIPFGGNVTAERRFGDLVLPSRVSVGWWFGKTVRSRPFFEAEILDAVPVDRPAGAIETHPEPTERRSKPGHGQRREPHRVGAR